MQYITENIITKNPRTPHTLLEEIPECDVIIYFIISLTFIIFNPIRFINYTTIYYSNSSQTI
nr:MAG TPA: hypothetical protein [Bacteriophage sp.]